MVKVSRNSKLLICDQIFEENLTITIEISVSINYKNYNYSR